MDERRWFLPDSGVYSDMTIPVLAMSGSRFEQIAVVGPGPKELVLAYAQEIVDNHNNQPTVHLKIQTRRPYYGGAGE